MNSAENESGMMFKALEEALNKIDVSDTISSELTGDQVNYRNNSYVVVSVFGYLIGVSKELFDSKDNPAMLKDVYNKLHKNKKARIVRNLCTVRTALERYYMPIVEAIRSGGRNIDTIPEFIPRNVIWELYEDGILLSKNHHDIDQYIISVNKEISNRIANVQTCFPEWLNWKYVKDLFIMPNGFTLEGIKAAGDFYNSNRNRYPYQCYMNWGLNDVGNILFCDEKFVVLLYELNNDYFDDLSLVRNAGDLTINSINDFLLQAEKAIFVVDCENSNPVKLASVLGGLDDEVKQHISNVLLFDSHYTSEGWDILSENATEEQPIKKASELIDENLFEWGSLSDMAGLNMEHIVVDRLLENKSQVDMTLAVRTTQEVYKNSVDAVVLVSSDSDYWAMISNLDDVDFLVMLEKEKTSRKITEQLDSKGFHHCFLDDFYTGESYTLKTDALKRYVQAYFDANLSFDADRLLDNAVYNSWVDMTEKEKKSFMDKYIRKSHIEIDNNGTFRIILGEK